MSILRKLSIIYALCALAFSTIMGYQHDPKLTHSRQAVADALDTIRYNVTAPVARVARTSLTRLANAVSLPAAESVTAPSATRTVVIPLVTIPAPRPLIATVRPGVRPTLATAKLPEIKTAADDFGPAPRPVRVTPAHLPPDITRHEPRRTAIDSVPAVEFAAPVFRPVAPSAVRPSLAPSELVHVTTRLKKSLTPEMLDNFGLFLYVSKADSGPLSQRLYVFRKDAGGDLAMLYDWPASTGRERDERAPNGTRQSTVTPQGYYQLDPNRMYRSHVSHQWHEQMPFAMFFNWQNNGVRTGLAIHGAAGLELAQLGTRASAGCIRIAPENAALLFRLIREQYKGLAPRFAYDRVTATMSNQGIMMHDAGGNLAMAEGYRVLVFIEDYGGANVVAAVY